MRASAPGKIMLAGEYAVLEGAEAIVMAVTRRAWAATAQRRWATETGDGQTLSIGSPFLQAAARVVAAELGEASVAARCAAEVYVDTSELQSDGSKLGLGSSAAATVAAIACALGDQLGELDIELVHRLAHTAHAEAQSQRGASGSGADVAASVYGGVIAARVDRDRTRPTAVRALLLPPSLTLVPVWTGTQADTPSLVSRVLDHRSTRAYRDAIDAITAAASAFAAACERGDTAAGLDAIREGAIAHTALGRIANLELETATHRRIAELAGTCGGAAKPTGAGGGDIAIAAFTERAPAERFVRALEAAGLSALDLALDPLGARLHLS